MELSPQTGRLVVTSGNTVAFIPALPRNNVPSHTLTLPYTPSSASIHPILQDRFVTGSLTDEWVRVHGIDGEEREVLKGHHGPVHCVEFSPDGEMYGSGSEDGALVILVFLYRASRSDMECVLQVRYDYGRRRQANHMAYGKDNINDGLGGRGIASVFCSSFFFSFCIVDSLNL